MNALLEMKELEKELECEPLLIGIEKTHEGGDEYSFDYIYTCDECDKVYCSHNAGYEQYKRDLENEE